MDKIEIKGIIERAKHKGLKTLDETISKKILSTFGVKVVQEIEVTGADHLEDVAYKLGYPLVLKGISKDIPHKSEMGLVVTNLNTFKQVKAAYKSIKSKEHLGIEKIIAQPQIQGSREFVAGMFRDPDFGPVVMFGLGGIFTEALKDFALRLSPVSFDEAVECIKEIKARELLGNFRGERAVSIESLANILVGLSDLALSFEEIKEIDINPIVATKNGEVVAVDALIGIDLDLAQKKYPPRIDPRNLEKFFLSQISGLYWRFLKIG